MKLYRSNQLEQLANQLVLALDSPLRSPLAQEVIVVQSRGMARWISFQIARISNICMNCEFPFPRTFIARTLRAFFPEMTSEEQFGLEVMTWKINRLLPTLAQRNEFAPIKNYLSEDGGLKAFQLSEQVARLFDQYLVYRPEMLLRWERDSSENQWQAILWRTLAGDNEPLHLARIYETLNERMRSSSECQLPERVAVFAVSSLPPLYLQVFLELSRHCEVHLFSLEPSREYHGQDLSPKMKVKLLNRLAARGATISADELPSGNPLLTSLGKLNRDFTEVRLDLDERAGFVTREQAEQFIEPNGGGMLQALQRDILGACNRGDGNSPKEEISVNDTSIQIHACHSPMREIEVLYDYLLDRFEQDPTLKPRDIIVMTPEIEKYGPFIQAVFAYPEDKQRFIPFSLADRRQRSGSPTIEAFLAFLALPGSRCTASEIFALLDQKPVRRRFAFTDEEMTLIRQWISESGVRWGIDAAHRKAFQLPDLDANTWCVGLNRLLLGYAMAGQNQTMFEGIMPYDEVEGERSEVLGRFISALKALFSLTIELSSGRLLSAWPEAIASRIDQVFLAESPEDLADLRVIRLALNQLGRTAELLGENQNVEFPVVRYHLEHLLDQGERRGGFLTGGVTFCALQPMRGIPARVICLVGMGDQDFPRQSHAPDIDLLASDRKFGDPATRDDDRYSFLEALISARERLYLSFVGRSSIDNNDIPPSVLVSELLDYLDQAFTFPENKNARDWIKTEHRLHSFSPRYFDRKIDRLFSYSEANAAASRSLLSIPAQPPEGFFAHPLSEPGHEFRRVELKSLIDFFANPAKQFMMSRLGLRLREADDALEDSEPFELHPLQVYSLNQELVAHSLAHQKVTVDEFAARGVLPLGEMGAACFLDLHRTGEEFSKRVTPALRGMSQGQPLLVDLWLDPFSLTGQIESIYGGRIIQFRCATLKPKDRLRAWITHLARCAADPGGNHETVLIGVDEGLIFSPLPGASAEIRKLLQIYWRGLSRALPFFPGSALAYATAKLFPKPSAKSTPLRKAQKEWYGSRGKNDGEKSDHYCAFSFPDREPLNKEFVELAIEVFEPLLRNLKDWP